MHICSATDHCESSHWWRERLWTHPPKRKEPTHWLPAFKQEDSCTPPGSCSGIYRRRFAHVEVANCQHSLAHITKRRSPVTRLSPNIFTPASQSLETYAHQDEGCRIYLRPEEQGRRRGRCALLVRAESDHLQVQDPSAGRADERVPAGHEQLLQQAQGAGAHAAHQQEGEQSGDPAARHRLYLGPAGRAGRAGEEPQRPSHTADHAKRRARQHRSGEWMLR